MANGVEERIVAAKFDSSDFEKGVDKTVKKLDELKESLDLKKTGEVLEKASEKANKSMDSLSKSVENLNNRFTSFWGMVKQNIVGGLAQKVSDVFMNMTNAVTGFVKSLSSTQMHAGLAQYEQLLTSVRMITNATYIDDKTGKKMNYTEEAAYEAMNKIVTYSDETSYSIDQMSDAMSKMVAAGVPLSKAADNVMGIANACAFAGVNATDAARAFFNLSQAYSSGSLKYTDYRSLELLNMTNEGFQEQLLKAGEEAGVLKKVKDGTWKTQKSDKNKKVTAGKTVTRQTLSESLKYNWASTDVMDQLFGKNFYANIDEIEDMLYTQGKSMAEVTKHIAENYGEVAAKAFAAAREARSFTDVMNTFKGIVSAGWSKTFQTLFGQLSQATKFFTDLADGGIANFIRQIGAWRNGVLEVWDAGSGGENFRQIILDIDAALGYHNVDDGEHPGLLNILTDLFPKIDDFGALLSKASHDAAVEVQHFRQFIIDAVDFMNTKMPDGMSRMDRLRKIFGQLSGAFSAIGRVLGIVTKRIQIVWTIIDPIFIGITNALLKITEPIEELGSGRNMQPFNDLANALDNVCIILRETMKYLGPFIETLGTIIGEIGNFIVGMSIDTVAMNIQFFGDIIRLFIDLFGTDEMKQMAAGQSVLEG